MPEFGWIWRDTSQEERDVALLEQAACGTARPTSGLIGYVDGEPAPTLRRRVVRRRPDAIS